MAKPSTAPMHGIKDNHARGSVADFLKLRVTEGSALSVVSAYFTIHAYEALRENLDTVERLRFLFGEPRFIGSLDPEKTERKRFAIEEDGLELANRLQQRQVAHDCARWLAEKVEIRSVVEANFVHGKMYHVDDGRREHAIVGSSNFGSSMSSRGSRSPLTCRAWWTAGRPCGATPARCTSSAWRTAPPCPSRR